MQSKKIIRERMKDYDKLFPTRKGVKPKLKTCKNLKDLENNMAEIIRKILTSPKPKKNKKKKGYQLTDVARMTNERRKLQKLLRKIFNDLNLKCEYAEGAIAWLMQGEVIDDNNSETKADIKCGDKTFSVKAGEGYNQANHGQVKYLEEAIVGVIKTIKDLYPNENLNLSRIDWPSSRDFLLRMDKEGKLSDLQKEHLSSNFHKYLGEGVIFIHSKGGVCEKIWLRHELPEEYKRKEKFHWWLEVISSGKKNGIGSLKMDYKFYDIDGLSEQIDTRMLFFAADHKIPTPNLIVEKAKEILKGNSKIERKRKEPILVCFKNGLEDDNWFCDIRTKKDK